jgi:transcriptional regulator with XRE-family HTH domain
MALFSDRLKYLREELGYSLQDIADECGVSKSSIHLYELGTRKPKRETLEELCCLFNVDMDYLLGKSDIRNATANLLGYNSLAEAYAAGVNVDETLKKIALQEPKLREGEEELLKLIRLMPDDMKAMYIEALRAALKTQGLM